MHINIYQMYRNIFFISTLIKSCYKNEIEHGQEEHWLSREIWKKKKIIIIKNKKLEREKEYNKIGRKNNERDSKAFFSLFGLSLWFLFKHSKSKHFLNFYLSFLSAFSVTCFLFFFSHSVHFGLVHSFLYILFILSASFFSCCLRGRFN